jgi:hypothetical protein
MVSARRETTGAALFLRNRVNSLQNKASVGLMPEFAEEITVTFKHEGLYAYICEPHLGSGMVGLIQVGDSAANQAAISGAKLRGHAKRRMDRLMAEAGLAGS